MRVVITGTDTDVGKTILSAALADRLGAHYWKPVQSGLDGPTDSQTVVGLMGPTVSILREAYRLNRPLSPNASARIDGVEISMDRLAIPTVQGSLVIEGAGGVLVPLSDSLLAADVFASWALPTVLVARTTLGTINHSLLSIEALRSRSVPLLGIFFIGPENPETEQCIATLGKVRHLGRVPMLEPLTANALRLAFSRTVLAEMAG